MGPREKELVARVIDEAFPNDGGYTTELERRVAEVCGVPHAVGVTSGTAAIFLALVGCGVGAGDEVLVPDVTFVATANAVTMTGARPVLVDVRREDLGIDPAAASAAITPRTRAIVPVHVSGRACDMEGVMALAARHGLAVVEDAAEALGSRWRGRALGAVGRAGCFSFSANKTVTAGQGGMIVTADAALHQRLRELKDQGRPVRGTGGDDEHPTLGFNFKLTNLQAAVALAQMETLPERLEHQRRLYRTYRDGLAGAAGVLLPPFDLDGGEVPQWVDALVDDRDSLHDFLLERGIGTRKFWHPVHTHAPYRADGSAFPHATEIGRRGLWLPSSLRLEDEDVATVCASIRAWAESRTSRPAVR